MTIESDRVRLALLALAGLQHDVVTRRQADGLGFGRRRVGNALRAGVLTEPIPGVLVVTGRPPTWHQRLAMVVFAAGGRGAASHRSAARLHHLDGFDGAGNAVVEASVGRRYRLAVDVAAVVHHVVALDPTDLTTVDGIACTTVARTLADLGSVVRDRRQLRRALTSARRRGLHVEAVRDVASRLHRPGQAGTGAMLRLLDTVPFEGVLPETWFEELIALCLDDPELPPFEAQCRIRDARGTIVARTDIGFPSVRLGLEAHSRRFHFGPDAEALDEDRDIIVSLCGWELVYLGWHATKRPAEVLRIVKDLITVRRAEQRVPTSREREEV